MIWDSRSSYSTKINGITGTQLFQTILIHHLTMLQVVFTAPRKRDPMKLEIPIPFSDCI